ncbi:hypothetical protein BDV96DRAFT_490049 [Lophiotrema nucula]|uniref:Uncharacterized protein n=1 Tax=Lophiotrema nucula TaxID=690887 RepID=A0A6A5ZDJ1_9PLEO|nr:hypothetical protein BDV96DRAFT_490049 [Lophiotrema nucula]
MRYSSALVLGTLAVGQAAAANVRHASFHARRSAEKKRADAYAGVNWADVTYDLSGVDWSSVFASKSTPTPTPEAKPSSSAAVIQAAEVKPSSSAAVIQAAEVKPTSSATPAYTPPATSSKEEAKPSETKASIGDVIEGVANDLTAGLSTVCSKLGFLEPSADGVSDKIWKGNDSPWTVNFANGASSTITVFCWAEADFGFTLNTKQALTAFTLRPGAKQTYSWAGGLSSSCSAVYPDTGKAFSGGIHNAWFEITFPDGGAGTGTFDVSRLPNMSGHAISAQGSKCLSDNDTCSFICNKIENPDEDSCTYDYSLQNCNAANGGGGGIDAKYNAVGGGCSTAADSESIHVTFS